MHTLWDWWRDIVIPAMGAIGIPIIVWLLTKHYGMDKAEERKLKQSISDNANYLLAVLHKSIFDFEEITEQTNYENRFKNLRNNHYTITYHDTYAQIKAKDFISFLPYDNKFLSVLLDVQHDCEILITTLEGYHNSLPGKLNPSEKPEIQKYLEDINEQAKNCAKKCLVLIEKIKAINSKNDFIKLVNIPYTEYETKLLEEINRPNVEEINVR